MEQRIVLVSGWGQSEHACEPLLSALKRSGAVEWVRPEGSLEDMIARLDVRLSGTGQDTRTLVVGWSLGGQLLLHWLSRRSPPYPKGLGLCLLASNPCFVARDGWPGVAEDVFQNFRSQLGSDPRGCLMRFQAMQTQGSDQGAADLRWLRRDPALSALNGGGEGLSRDELRTTLEWLLTLDERKTLANWPEALRRPLVLLGENDVLIPPSLAHHLQPWADVRTLPKMAHYPGLATVDTLVGLVTGWWTA